MTRRLIEVDTREVLEAAGVLGRMTGAGFSEAGLRAVNEVAPVMERRAREAIVGGINVTDQYVRARMGVRLADDALRPEAVIYAPFRHTPLGRYQPKQLVKPVATRKNRSKGDKSRGIAAGMRSAGVSVEVTRGQRKPIQQGFIMPLRNGNGPGVFTRSHGELRFQHRLGPSVYQLFRVQADLLADEASNALQAAVVAEADRVLNEVTSE